MDGGIVHRNGGKGWGKGGGWSPRGIISACVTPFDRRGRIDLGVQRMLLERQISAGVHGVFVVGTAGEFWALSCREKEALYRNAVEVAGGRVPVLVGTCANTTAEAVDLARRAEAVGVDAVVVLTPFAVKLSQRELLRHFRAVAEAVGVRVVLYSNPRLTGVRIEPMTVAELVASCPNICAIKDSSGEVEGIRSLVAALPEGFAVLNGHDAHLLEVLEAGAVGGVSGSANAIPEVCVALYEGFASGNIALARLAQESLLRFREAWSWATPPAVVRRGRN